MRKILNVKRGSEVPTNFVATCTPGMRKSSHTPNQQVTGKEKGRTANATLWDDCFFNHEENQYSPVLDDGRKPNLAYEENQYLAEPQDNYTGISGEVQPSCCGVLQQFRKTCRGAHYETFVVNRVTNSNPVQPSGASFDFLRCSALSLRPQASSTQVEKFTLEPLSFSCSTLASISAVSSCGKRIPLYMVLLFMWFFAMLNLIECLNKGKITVKNEAMKLFKQNALTCLNTLSNLFKQSDSIRMKIAKPSSVSSTDRASNHNVIGANTMACQHSTQTRPKFVFLFLGTPNEFPNTTPTVLRVEADTEDEGRAKFIGWTLIFAAQIRTEAPCRLQLFSTDEGFMWVYEQRQSVKESSHA